jgi:hypothetical protein
MSKTHKGDWHRLGNAPAYRENYDEIFRKKTHDPIHTDPDDTGTREKTPSTTTENRKTDRHPSHRTSDPE